MNAYHAIESDVPELAKMIKKNSSYEKCLQNTKGKKMKLCPEGYCTAKEKFEVYPSAYANAYASQVCSGKKPDASGQVVKRYVGEKPENSSLDKWFKEKWVNVCEKDEDGEYLPCGRKKADLDGKNYPYCRPLNKVGKDKGEGGIKTVGELSAGEIKEMCALKRGSEQGVDGKPTRVYLKK